MKRARVAALILAGCLGSLSATEPLRSPQANGAEMPAAEALLAILAA